MKGFKKLALATAVAALSTSAFAMQPVADAELSGVTGQDGISIGITTPATGLVMDQWIFDRDGLASISSDGGVIVIEGFSVNTGGAPLTVDIDADGNGGSAVLNVAVGLPSNFSIDTGDLSVADDTSTGADGWDWSFGTKSSVILHSTNISLSGATLNIQLGNVVQQLAGTSYNPMILLGGTISGGIDMTNTQLTDASPNVVGGGTAGDITIARTQIVDAGGQDLGLDVGIGVNTNGLQIAMGTGFGATSVNGDSSLDIYQTGVQLGSAPAIGDIAIKNLSLAGTTITISGK